MNFMRELSFQETAEVSGSGGILIVGALAILYTAAFIGGGPVGLGIAVAATIAEQGVEKLDTLVEQGKIT